jgi:BirA family biotin operon repressor/biotin-[acetyl-CoA-carboxylase] ligase
MERKVMKYKKIDSTNREVERIIKKWVLWDSLFLVADYQYYGRGQGTNKWESKDGKNLLMSWGVVPAFLSVTDQFQLSKAVSLAILDMLMSHSLQCKIKWPNDIVCNSRKIGGILIENSIIGGRIKHSIIGIGLNVNQELFSDFPFKATSMFLELGTESEITSISEQLMDLLENRFFQLKQGGADLINNGYVQNLYKIDEESTFSDGKIEFAGRIRGVSDVGELLIEMTDGSVETFGFHQIKMLH